MRPAQKRIRNQQRNENNVLFSALASARESAAKPQTTPKGLEHSRRQSTMPVQYNLAGVLCIISVIRRIKLVNIGTDDKILLNITVSQPSEKTR